MTSPGSLTYDWASHGSAAPRSLVRAGLVDETLRDGLQGASVRQPTLSAKLRFLEAALGLGVDAVNLGFPAAGGRAFDDALALVTAAGRRRPTVTPQCVARTREEDLRPVAEIAQRAGVRVEVGLFIGSSSLRREAEAWTLDESLRRAERCVGWAVGHGLEVLFVTEDTTRSFPDDVRRLYAAAVRAGARRVCVADTVGFATPEAAAALTRFVRSAVDAAGGGHVGVDWHGHNDRGLAVANALAAAVAGASRVHGTALGIGERTGNAAVEQLVVNAWLEGWSRPDPPALSGYLAAAEEALGLIVPAGAPVAGRDAFTTAAGVHAAAVLKALRRGDEALADRVYSAIPAAWVGRRQAVEVGPHSGASNVELWLLLNGHVPRPGAVARILAIAKGGDRSLTDDELRDAAADETRAAAGE